MTEAAATEVAPGITQEQAPSAEYVAQMTAAAHGDPTPAPAQAPSATPRPAHVPEKFWDPIKGEARWEDLAKSYVELEKMQSGKKPEAAPAADPAADPKADTTKIERPKEGEPTPFATAFKSVAEVYSTKGTVEADDVKALIDLGIPQENIDIYFAGLKALEVQGTAKLHEIAGGKDAFNAAQEWAAKELSDDDLAYYNANIDNPASRTQTVEWLMAKHAGAAPASEGKLIGADPSAASGDIYASDAQVTQAMRDPRYKSDPAYRQSVAEKMFRSQKAGTLNTSATYHSRAR